MWRRIQWRNGQRTIRAQKRSSTCRPALVCMWKCVHMTFCPSAITKMCVRVTTRKLNMSATEGENERELENKKRGRRQRCSSVVSVQMWVWKDTYRHMFRNTHTADWHKATQLIGFTSAWCGSTLETPVHSDYGSCTGQGTQTHTDAHI